MMSGLGDFKNEIDWNVLKDQQMPKAPAQNQQVADDQTGQNVDQPLGQRPDQGEMVDTFLGKMPKQIPPEYKPGTPEFNKSMEDMINVAVGGPGMQMIGKAGVPLAKAGITKAMDYLNPGKKAEQFRSSLGEGTSAENIDTLSKRAKLAKESTKQEALIPKNELYAQEGKSDVYNYPKSSLPEGNMDRLSGMFDPGGQFQPSQMDALSKALSKYRKTGDIDSFMDKSEDIFNIADLPEKAASKIEDALELPTKRDSAYFKTPDLTSAYSPRGKLMELHNAYEEKPILSNYDALQSALKKELRSMEGRAKVSDTAVPKVEQLQENIKNLNADKESFMKTLPDNMKNLENEFRQKYAKYAETYEKGAKETGASLTLRRLAEGRGHLVDDAAVVRLFSKPTAADKKALLDMGEGGARNALYAALQKVPQGDAEGMAKTILDLKRTKGFDKIVTPEIENWANNMLSHTKKVGNIKKGLAAAGGAAAGSAILGPIGLIGAAAPYAPKAVKYIAERFKK